MVQLSEDDILYFNQKQIEFLCVVVIHHDNVLFDYVSQRIEKEDERALETVVQLVIQYVRFSRFHCQIRELLKQLRNAIHVNVFGFLSFEETGFAFANVV